MGIYYDALQHVFSLNTQNTTYMIGVADNEGFLGHIYYGEKLGGTRASYLLRTGEAPYLPSGNNRERNSFLDCFPMEYPVSGLGDYRESCLTVRSQGGHRGGSLQYVSHKIFSGKPGLDGLPALFGSADECTTLEILCTDPALGLTITLGYTVFEDVDVITRNIRVRNDGQERVYLEKVLSACLDMDDEDFEMITLHGSWARERRIQRQAIGYGRRNAASFRGQSGHQEHPFLALVTPETTQDSGTVYGMHFVYSGNFIAQAEKNQFDSVRMTMGIHPEGFTWRLCPGEEFQAPEVVMVYTSKGLGQMTRILHDTYRRHLIRSPYLHQKRPILINNWEATYFDFDTEKLISIAEEAKKAGIEMLVMDDGWFGKRSSDDSSLGDWVVNEEKIKGGLAALVERVKHIGLQFGIWFEPEMISPDSQLYRAHPDWAIQIPGREPTQSRAQYVLDLSRPEIINYVFESVAGILRSADISYVKWDMNRQLCAIGSYGLENDCQGELYHRYVLGVYQLQERLLQEFPNLLLENCSGGGARFDPGMLYYSPQIWCSDNTDAIERLAIQEGTMMLYPLSTIGAHVSACPNHTVGRTTPFETRGHVALAGTFGYELDITALPEEELTLIRQQTAMYHKFNDLVREGSYYRLVSWTRKCPYDCWQVVSQDQRECLVTYVQVLGQANTHSKKIRLRGLLPDGCYRLESTGERYAGDDLMYAGYLVSGQSGDFQSRLLHFVLTEQEH